MQMIDANTIHIEPELIKLIPKNVAIDFRVVPLSLSGDALTVLFSLKPNHQTLSDLAFLTGKKITVELATDETLNSLLQKYYNVSALDVQRVTQQSAEQFYSVQESSEQ